MRNKGLMMVAMFMIFTMVIGCQQSRPNPTDGSTEPVQLSATRPIEVTEPSVATTVPPLSPTTESTPTSGTEPDTQLPTRNPAESETPSPDGAAVVYDYGGGIWALINADTSGLVKGSLYYLDFKTKEFHLVFSGPIIDQASNGTHVFFVPQSEPTKIYSAPLENLGEHSIFYESNFGSINWIFPSVGPFDTVFQIVEGNKRLIILEIETMESTVVTEQHYIEKATIELNAQAKSWRDYDEIYFVGKRNEKDTLGEYLYNAETGEIHICPHL